MQINPLEIPSHLNSITTLQQIRGGVGNNQGNPVAMASIQSSANQNMLFGGNLTGRQAAVEATIFGHSNELTCEETRMRAGSTTEYQRLSQPINFFNNFSQATTNTGLQSGQQQQVQSLIGQLREQQTVSARLQETLFDFCLRQSNLGSGNQQTLERESSCAECYKNREELISLKETLMKAKSMLLQQQRQSLELVRRFKQRVSHPDASEGFKQANMVDVKIQTDQTFFDVQNNYNSQHAELRSLTSQPFESGESSLPIQILNNSASIVVRDRAQATFESTEKTISVLNDSTNQPQQQESFQNIQPNNVIRRNEISCQQTLTSQSCLPVTSDVDSASKMVQNSANTNKSNQRNIARQLPNKENEFRETEQINRLANLGNHKMQHKLKQRFTGGEVSSSCAAPGGSIVSEEQSDSMQQNDQILVENSKNKVGNEQGSIQPVDDSRNQHRWSTTSGEIVDHGISSSLNLEQQIMGIQKHRNPAFQLMVPNQNVQDQATTNLPYITDTKNTNGDPTDSSVSKMQHELGVHSSVSANPSNKKQIQKQKQEGINVEMMDGGSNKQAISPPKFLLDLNSIKEYASRKDQESPQNAQSVKKLNALNAIEKGLERQAGEEQNLHCTESHILNSQSTELNLQLPLFKPDGSSLEQTNSNFVGQSAQNLVNIVKILRGHQAENMTNQQNLPVVQQLHHPLPPQPTISETRQCLLHNEAKHNGLKKLEPIRQASPSIMHESPSKIITLNNSIVHKNDQPTGEDQQNLPIAPTIQNSLPIPQYQYLNQNQMLPQNTLESPQINKFQYSSAQQDKDQQLLNNLTTNQPCSQKKPDNNGFTFRLRGCDGPNQGSDGKKTGGKTFKNMLCSSEARKGERDHPLLLGSFRDTGPGKATAIPQSARSTAKLSECSLLSGDQEVGDFWHRATNKIIASKHHYCKMVKQQKEQLHQERQAKEELEQTLKEKESVIDRLENLLTRQKMTGGGQQVLLSGSKLSNMNVGGHNHNNQAHQTTSVHFQEMSDIISEENSNSSQNIVQNGKEKQAKENRFGNISGKKASENTQIEKTDQEVDESKKVQILEQRVPSEFQLPKKEGGPRHESFKSVLKKNELSWRNGSYSGKQSTRHKRQNTANDYLLRKILESSLGQTAEEFTSANNLEHHSKAQNSSSDINCGIKKEAKTASTGTRIHKSNSQNNCVDVPQNCQAQNLKAQQNLQSQLISDTIKKLNNSQKDNGPPNRQGNSKSALSSHSIPNLPKPVRQQKVTNLQEPFNEIQNKVELPKKIVRGSKEATKSPFYQSYTSKRNKSNSVLVSHNNSPCLRNSINGQIQNNESALARDRVASFTDQVIEQDFDFQKGSLIESKTKNQQNQAIQTCQKPQMKSCKSNAAIYRKKDSSAGPQRPSPAMHVRAPGTSFLSTQIRMQYRSSTKPTSFSYSNKNGVIASNFSNSGGGLSKTPRTPAATSSILNQPHQTHTTTATSRRITKKFSNNQPIKGKQSATGSSVSVYEPAKLAVSTLNNIGGSQTPGPLLISGGSNNPQDLYKRTKKGHNNLIEQPVNHQSNVSSTISQSSYMVNNSFATSRNNGSLLSHKSSSKSSSQNPVIASATQVVQKVRKAGQRNCASARQSGGRIPPPTPSSTNHNQTTSSFQQQATNSLHHNRNLMKSVLQNRDTNNAN